MIRNRFTFAILLSALLVLLSFSGVHSQEIKTLKDIKTTSVKNQANSGTCWSFAVVSMIESELMRLGKGEYDISEMYFARMAYLTKAERYFRLQGHLNFGGGGQAHDVFDVWKKWGIVPEDAYSGLVDGATRHDHSEMDAVLVKIMEITQNPDIEGGDTKWKAAIDSVLNIYLGRVPNEFEYKNKRYTPQSFAKETGINPEDYIEITSFTHHPFYSKFVLEVPDNWSSGIYYNIPENELMLIIENALMNGYTVAWDGDVSDDVSFSANNGIAKLENDDNQVTPEIRQQNFDNFSTTDDHLMLLTGIGKDETGKKFFLTKNSWGTNKGNKGYWWMSENYIRMKTIAIMVNRKCVPDDIAVKAGILNK